MRMLRVGASIVAACHIVCLQALLCAWCRDTRLALLALAATWHHLVGTVPHEALLLCSLLTHGLRLLRLVVLLHGLRLLLLLLDLRLRRWTSRVWLHLLRCDWLRLPLLLLLSLLVAQLENHLELWEGKDLSSRRPGNLTLLALTCCLCEAENFPCLAFSTH